MFAHSSCNKILKLKKLSSPAVFPVSLIVEGRRDGLIVRALDSGSSGPGSSHCVVFLGKTLDSHGASLHPGV